MKTLRSGTYVPLFLSLNRPRIKGKRSLGSAIQRKVKSWNALFSVSFFFVGPGLHVCAPQSGMHSHGPGQQTRKKIENRNATRNTFLRPIHLKTEKRQETRMMDGSHQESGASAQGLTFLNFPFLGWPKDQRSACAGLASRRKVKIQERTPPNSSFDDDMTMRMHAALAVTFGQSCHTSNVKNKKRRR